MPRRPVDPPKPMTPPPSDAAPQRPPLVPAPFVWRHPSQIPQRMWVLDSYDFEEKDLPRRARRAAARIELDRTPPVLRGEPLDEIWWRGRQWAVTAYGIERLDGTYTIEADLLRKGLPAGEPSWPVNISRKRGADGDEFATAWMVALLLHGQAAGLDATVLLPIFAAMQPARREAAP